MKKILKTFRLRIVSGSVLFSEPGPSLFRDGSQRNTRSAQRVLQELCGGVKPLSAFYKHPGMADGHPRMLAKIAGERTSVAVLTIRSANASEIRRRRVRSITPPT
jgi:hypothetical protein